MAVFVWDKPVLVFYRYRRREPEKDPFAVVKARKLLVLKSDNGSLSGNIDDFFPLMGDTDCISANEGTEDKYILCWFDDEVESLKKAERKLVGLTFSSGISYIADKEGKRIYSAVFNAERGKLQ